MISDTLARFSIKSRLRSANHSILKQPPSPSPATTSKQIHVPEHYNYFLQTVEKEIKHQAHTFRKIKQKIEEYKSRKDSRSKIKNAFSYSHQCFPRSNTRKKGIKSQNNYSKTVPNPFKQISNTETNFIYPITSQTTTQIGRKNRGFLTSAKSASSFVRSPQTTVQQFAQKMEEKEEIFLEEKVSKENGKRGKLRKQGGFELTGTKPRWAVFQSYRTCFNSALRTPL